MKSVTIILSLFAISTQLMHSMDLFDQPDEISTKPAPGMFRLFGKKSYKDITNQVALSIPLLKPLVLSGNIATDKELSDFDESDLIFLQKYASIRNLLEQGKLPNTVEDTLTSTIADFDLTTLSKRTIILGTLYNEKIPKGFDKAWSHQLNIKEIGRGDVPLIKDIDSLDLVFALQDHETLSKSALKEYQKSLKPDSNLAQLPQDNLEPVYFSRKELSELNITSLPVKSSEDSEKQVPENLLVKWYNYFTQAHISEFVKTHNKPIGTVLFLIGCGIFYKLYYDKK